MANLTMHRSSTADTLYCIWVPFLADSNIDVS